MAKRKITVTVDEETVDLLHQLGGTESMSALVNAALASHVDRLARAQALRDQLDAWDEQFGPVSDAAIQAAETAFDELDAGSADHATHVA